MALLHTPICSFGLDAPTFRLQATDGLQYGLEDIKGSNGLLVMFICNHCPYVLSIIRDLVATVQALQKEQIGVVAIMANDTVSYPADSFDNMKIFAKEHRFTFPYLIDETQEVARAYHAVCTPDFFGYDRHCQLQYRGRFASKTTTDLFDAMTTIAKGENGPAQQFPSMGCSIKWKNS